MSKLLALIVLGGAGAAVMASLPEIKRYMKISRM
jgi:hypothetical protein